MSFERLTFVASQGGGSTAQDYTWLDRAPLEGRSFYRLRQTDLDGTETLSDVRMVNMDGGVALVSVFPVPANSGDELRVILRADRSDKATLSVSNVLGQAVYEQVMELPTGQHELMVPTHGWSAGTYFVKVATSSGVATSRINVVGAEGC